MGNKLKTGVRHTDVTLALEGRGIANLGYTVRLISNKLWARNIKKEKTQWKENSFILGSTKGGPRGRGRVQCSPP